MYIRYNLYHFINKNVNVLFAQYLMKSRHLLCIFFNFSFVNDDLVWAALIFYTLTYCLQILQIFDFMIQNIFKESTAYKEDTKMNKGKIILCRQLEGRLMVQRVVQGLNVLLISVDGIPGVRFKTWSTKYVEDECRWSIVIWTLQKWGKVA